MDFLKEFKELVFFKTKFPEQLFYDGLDYLDLFKISNFNSAILEVLWEEPK